MDSDVNLKKLINFTKNKSFNFNRSKTSCKIGAIKIKGNKVFYFKEKSSLDEGWINGGFFVMEPNIFKYLLNDNTFLEKNH